MDSAPPVAAPAAPPEPALPEVPCPPVPAPPASAGFGKPRSRTSIGELNGSPQVDSGPLSVSVSWHSCSQVPVDTSGLSGTYPQLGPASQVPSAWWHGVTSRPDVSSIHGT